MDGKLVTDVLKIAGLPGLVVVGWIAASITGQASATNLAVWGLALLAAIVVNFLSVRSRSITNDVQHTINNALHASIKPLVETVKNMTEIEDRLIDEVTALKDIYEGGLTTKQLRFLMPRIFDTFKWRVMRICINITTPKGHIVFERKNMEETVVTQVCSSLSALAEYNHVLRQEAAVQSVHKALANIFDVLYGPEFINIEDYKQRVSSLLEIIRTELDLCSTAILDLLNQTESPPAPPAPRNTDNILSKRGPDTDE